MDKKQKKVVKHTTYPKYVKGYYFIASNQHLRLCGLNAVNNMFHTQLMTVDYMNECIEVLTMKEQEIHPNTPARIGDKDIGNVSVHLMSYMLQKKGFIMKKIYDCIHPGYERCFAMMKQIIDYPDKKMLVYGWKIGPLGEADAHYLSCPGDGTVISDKRLARGKVVEVRPLTEENLKRMLFSTYTCIKVWEIQPQRQKKQKQLNVNVIC